MRGMSKNATRSPERRERGRSRDVRRERTPSRSATASVASPRIASGSRHAGRLAAMSPADDEGQLVLRAAVMQLPSGYRPCTTARPLDLERARPRGARRPPRRAGTAPAAPPRRGRRRPPCAAAGHRHQHDAVEPELVARLLAPDEVAEVRRVERPAEDADCASSGPRTWPVALDDVLERAQLAQRRSGRARGASGSSCRSRRPSRTRRRR